MYYCILSNISIYLYLSLSIFIYLYLSLSIYRFAQLCAEKDLCHSYMTFNTCYQVIHIYIYIFVRYIII